jgi:hypothetical protein
MNWPEELSPTLPHDADVTVRYSAIQCRSADTTECLIMVGEHARTIDRHAVRVFARAITPRRTVAIDRLEAVIYARATVYICIGYDMQMRAEMPHRVRHLGGDADRGSRRRG